MPVFDRVKNAWNAFTSDEERRASVNSPHVQQLGQSNYYQPFRNRISVYSKKSIVTALYARISIDTAALDIKHVRVDEKNRFKETLDSALNDRLTFESNIDQAPRTFIQDAVMTMFDTGTAAIVAVETTADPATNANYDILQLRVGTVKEWFPEHVRVDVFDQHHGRRREIIVPKRNVAIATNPLYSVMNEPNSTLSRLIHKLDLLDQIDDASGSGKLDLIIQLPYVIKSEARKLQAEGRRDDIEMQLKGSKYGIAYTDGTEKITQLNRPAENNLMGQIEYLTTMLYGQLGVTEDIMNGTASESTMLNYFNRTIEPVMHAITAAMQRTFIGELRTDQKERVSFYRDPFKLVPAAQLAEIADKFTRNEIFTANEIRQFMGVPPSDDPKADQLVNSNMPQAEGKELSQSTDEEKLSSEGPDTYG